MNYRLLGSTGVSVSELCLGTMAFGWTADEEESSRVYRLSREAGINFFDCANVYAGGESEKILGKLIGDERDEIVLTSKYTFRTAADVNGIGASRRNAVREVEKSLKRLATDRIDIYFIHCFDPSTAIEESLRAMDDLVRAGKILYIGVSNWAARQIAKALGVSFHYGWDRISCIQPMYSLLKRQAEVEILPLAQEERLGVITYSPLAGGLLSGKHRGNSLPEQGRFVEKPMYRQRYSESGYSEAAQEFAAFAKERGFPAAALAVAWVSSHPAVTAPIIGPRNREQLSGLLKATEITMTASLRDEISALYPPPPPATDRLEERVDSGNALRGGGR